MTAVVARNSTLMCLRDHLFIRKTGGEQRRHAVVVGTFPGNPLRELHAKNWDGLRLPRSMTEDSAATADRSVRSVFSPDEMEQAIQLAAARAVDFDTGARFPIPQRRLNSKTTVLRRTCQEATHGGEVGGQGTLMRRMGESTLVDADDARIQSLEVVVTEADELIENGEESGARCCSWPSWQRYVYVHDEQGRRHPRHSPVALANVPLGAASGWQVTVLCG